MCQKHAIASVQNNQSAAHLAAGGGGVSTLKVLVERGANLDLQDKVWLVGLVALAVYIMALLLKANAFVSFVIASLEINMALINSNAPFPSCGCRMERQR